MNLDQLKATIEAEALRRQAAKDGFTLEAVESFLGQGLVAPPELSSPVPPPPAPPVPYAYFASLHGRELVNACYAILLGRGADPGGMGHYMTLLGQGEDKAFIVGSFAFSAEGRARKVSVPGLLPHFLIAASRRVPVLGTVAAWGFAFLTLHLQARHMRALEHYMRLRLDAIGSYVGKSNAQVALRLEGLRTVLEARD